MIKEICFNNKKNVKYVKDDLLANRRSNYSILKEIDKYILFLYKKTKNIYNILKY